MSQELWRRLTLSKAERERITKERQRAAAVNYLEICKKMCRHAQEWRDDEFIPAELNSLMSDMERLASLIDTDPKTAQQLGQQLAKDANRMEALALQRRRNAQQAALKLYYDITAGVTDAVVINSAAGEFAKLFKEISSGNTVDESKITERAAEILRLANIKADEITKEQAEEAARRAAAQTISDIGSGVATDTPKGDKAITQLQSRLSELKEAVLNGSADANEAIETGQRLAEDAQNSLIAEDEMKKAATNIVAQLRSQEFEVKALDRVSEADGDCIRIVAKRPSGKTAVCSVYTDGKLNYKFDHYEEMTCLKDIEKFNVDLEKIYNMKLTEGQVVWSNPDRLAADAKPRPNSVRGNR